MKISIDDTLPFAALTVGQARPFLESIFSDSLAKLAAKEPPPESPKPERLFIDEAVVCLREHGYATTKGNLFNLVNTRSIPFLKIGRRVVFTRTELAAWVDQKTTNETISNVALTIAESARRKR